MADGLSSTDHGLRTNQVENIDRENGERLWKEAQLHKRRFESMLKFTHLGTTRGGPEPFELDVQLARTSLRNSYLTLLLYETSLRDKHNVSVLLWNHTTYAVIAAFQEQLAKLEMEIRNAETKRHAAPKSQRRSAKLHEYEHALYQFMLFLKNESVFWQDLLLRVVRVFHWESITPLLDFLDLLDTDLIRDQCISTSYNQNSNRSFKTILRSCEPALSQASLRLLQRLLMFCGDLERYIERKSHKPLFLIQRRSKHFVVLPYDFSSTKKWYRTAQQIPTNSGSPARKLALIAAESGAPFKALVLNYHALCASEPDEIAHEQMQSLLEHIPRKGLSPDVAATNNTISKLHSCTQADMAGQKCVVATLLLHAHLFRSRELIEIMLSAHQLFELLNSDQEALENKDFNLLDLLISLICADSLGINTYLPAIIVKLISLLCVSTTQALGKGDTLLFPIALPATRIGLKWLYVNPDKIKSSIQSDKQWKQQLSKLNNEEIELQKIPQPKIIPDFMASYTSLLDAIPPHVCPTRRYFAEDADLQDLATFRDALHPPIVTLSPKDTTAYLEDLLADAHSSKISH